MSAQTDKLNFYINLNFNNEGNNNPYRPYGYAKGKNEMNKLRRT